MATSGRDAGPCVEIPICTTLKGTVPASKPYIAAGDVTWAVCGLKADNRGLKACT